MRNTRKFAMRQGWISDFPYKNEAFWSWPPAFKNAYNVLKQQTAAPPRPGMSRMIEVSIRASRQQWRNRQESRGTYA